MKKVLIIDDEKDLCLLLKSYLTQKHHQVYIAYKLNDGLQKAMEIRPDIVFLDNNLPDGYGWDKADWLHNEFPMLEIILMSAFKTAPHIFDDPGRIHILEKPVSYSTLDYTLQLMH